MKNIELYQPLILELLRNGVDFQTDNQNEMLKFGNDLYIRVETDNFDEAMGYSVGAKLRETDFKLYELNKVVNFIQKEIESE